MSVDAQRVARVREAFEAAGYRVEREHGAAQPSGPDFLRLVSEDSVVIVEVQFAKTALQNEVIARARSDRLGGCIATVEDLLVLKLIADRPKDRVDLDGLASLPDVDWSYVERWCREWEILDRLERLRGRSG